MSRPEHMEKTEFNLYWSVKPFNKIYIGSGSYIFRDTKKVWTINFTEGTPKEIVDRVNKIFIQQTEPDSLDFLVSTLENFERTLYNQIFELHDEWASCLKFPEQCYKKIEDPLLKKLVKEKIKEWANSKEYLGENLTKKLLKELDEKLEEIDALDKK